ncbi:hypothetical protein [Mandarin fish ranavirus]|nr:hypothetical protein [Mandarin fish ranavirus]
MQRWIYKYNLIFPQALDPQFSVCFTLTPRIQGSVGKRLVGLVCFDCKRCPGYRQGIRV